MQEPDFQYKILLVDDDDITLQFLSIGLRKHGFEIETTCDGEAAWEKIQSGDFPLVISDWEMPNLDGLNLCRRIRESDLPDYVYFILITSHDKVEDVVEGIEAGADEFIRKPVTPTELVARVRSIERLMKLNKRIQDQNGVLKNNQKLKDDWIHMIVHDLRAPLTAIIGYSDLLQEDASPEVSTPLGVISKEAGRIQEFLEQMLLMAKSEEKDLKLSKRLTDVKTIIGEAEKMYEPLAKRKKCLLKFDTDGVNKEMLLDSSLFRRVIDNLVSNSLKFSPPGSNVEVGCKMDNLELVVSVSDQGPGVPVESRHNLFQKYAAIKLKGVMASQHGLGLYFCKTVAEAHGGSISFVPVKPKGSCFEVRFPVSVE